LTKCGDLSEVEAEGMEMEVVAVKMVVVVEALETAVVTIMTAALTVKTAVMIGHIRKPRCLIPMTRDGHYSSTPEM
jgi:hypothetical protein